MRDYHIITLNDVVKHVRRFAKMILMFRLLRICVRIGAIIAQVVFGRARIVPLAIGTMQSASSVPTSATVVCHLYYPDLFDELLAASVRAPLVERVLFTCAYEHLNQVERLVEAAQPSNSAICLQVRPYKNSGRDLQPFLLSLSHPWVREADLVLKIHGKRSPHLGAEMGDAWRLSLLAGLSPITRRRHRRLECVLRRANNATQPNLIWPARWAFSVESWGANKPTTVGLLREYGIEVNRPLLFPAGSMFWCNKAFVAVLLGLTPLSGIVWTTGPDLPQDGACEHSVERAIGGLGLNSKAVVLTL